MLSNFGKKSTVLGAAAAMVAAPLLSGALTANASPERSPAPAPEAVLTCDLSGTAEFSPALSLNPAGESTQMKVEGEASGCKGQAARQDEVVSAKFSGDLSGKMSCTSLPRGVGGDVEITWTYADGSTKTSTADFELNMEGDLSKPSQPITGAFTGEGTDGEFKGNKHTGKADIDPSSLAGGCLTGGVKSMDFSGSYEMSK
ncbi:hypothetical protein [Saccharopolyspora griseoalba]|uniref:Ig-like domain-containing protein n=1 Tax=Saccharopolyspora griseoalba TaxID=1431848 RepID=A0ABW2LMQ6_9PSEU